MNRLHFLRRYAAAIASGLSLILCLAMGVMQVRSYYTADTLMVGLTSRWELACCSIDGHVNCCVGRLTEIDRGHRIRLLSDSLLLPADSDGGVLDDAGFAFPSDESAYFEDGRGWGRSEHLAFPILGWRLSRSTGQISFLPTPKIESWFVSPRDWQLMLLLAVLPTWSLRRLVRTRARIAMGGCRACGYNLTGNTSGVCPECGRAISQKMESKA